MNRECWFVSIKTVTNTSKDICHLLSSTLIEDACTTRDLSLYEKQIPALTVHQSIMTALSGLYVNVTRADNWIRESTR
jgi:hypothetical protein